MLCVPCFADSDILTPHSQAAFATKVSDVFSSLGYVLPTLPLPPSKQK